MIILKTCYCLLLGSVYLSFMSITEEISKDSAWIGVYPSNVEIKTINQYQ